MSVFLRRFSRLLALLVALLVACQALPLPAASPEDDRPTSTPSALSSATGAATPVPTATFTPAPTVTRMATQPPQPSATPAVTKGLAGAPTLTPPPNQEYFFSSDVPDFAFPADPTRWMQAKSVDNPYELLTHRSLPGCLISTVPGRGIGTPAQLLHWQLGRLSWLVYDYHISALASIEEPQGLFLELRGYQDAGCRADQQAVLAGVLLVTELEGQVAYDPLFTATPPPAPAGFSCPNTPPVRLQVGDWVHLVTDDLWLRSAPRAEPATAVSQFSQADPYLFIVTDGPVCGGKYVYWQVRVAVIGGEAPTEPLTGWLAEGDLQEYYLAPGL